MAIVVEDGSGMSTANSYGSLAGADSFHSDRGRSDWAAATDENKTAALIRGTDRMERRFAHRWKGARVDGDQALSWPRQGVTLPDGTQINDDVVPVKVVSACYEYARLALGRDELDPVPAETDASVNGKLRRQLSEQSVGDLSVRTDEEFESSSERVQFAQQFGDRPPTSLSVSEASIMEYPVADLWLDGLLLRVDQRTGGHLGACVSGEGSEFGEGWQDDFVNTGRRLGSYGEYG